MAQPKTPPPLTKQSKDFYLPGADLYLKVRFQSILCFPCSYDSCFQISDTVFRVHSYFFARDSKMFEKQLEAARNNCETNQARKGSNEDVAIALNGCTVEQFEKFLWVFYNPYVGPLNRTT